MRSEPGIPGAGRCPAAGLALLALCAAPATAAAALGGADVQATAMFYGSVETTLEAVEPLRAPLLGIFGDQDRGIAVADVKEFQEALKAAGKVAEIRIYAGVGSYDATSAGDAWVRTREFFARYLKPRPASEGRGN